MKELTKAEEQIMQILWKKQKAFVKDLIEDIAEPKPAYNTVSTIVRILEKKGFVDHTAYGKTFEYFPIVEKDEYKKGTLKKIMKNYFGDSFKQMVSFFSKEEDISLKELDEMINLLKEQKKQKEQNK